MKHLGSSNQTCCKLTVVSTEITPHDNVPILPEETLTTARFFDQHREICGAALIVMTPKVLRHDSHPRCLNLHHLWSAADLRHFAQQTRAWRFYLPMGSEIPRSRCVGNAAGSMWVCTL